jgi:hypothetical protein
MQSGESVIVEGMTRRVVHEDRLWASLRTQLWRHAGRDSSRVGTVWLVSANPGRMRMWRELWTAKHVGVVEWNPSDWQAACERQGDFLEQATPLTVWVDVTLEGGDWERTRWARRLLHAPSTVTTCIVVGTEAVRECVYEHMDWVVACCPVQRSRARSHPLMSSVGGVDVRAWQRWQMWVCHLRRGMAWNLCTPPDPDADARLDRFGDMVPSSLTHQDAASSSQIPEPPSIPPPPPLERDGATAVEDMKTGVEEEEEEEELDPPGTGDDEPSERERSAARLLHEDVLHDVLAM